MVPGKGNTNTIIVTNCFYRRYLLFTGNYRLIRTFISFKTYCRKRNQHNEQ